MRLSQDCCRKVPAAGGTTMATGWANVTTRFGCIASRAWTKVKQEAGSFKLIPPLSCKKLLTWVEATEQVEEVLTKAGLTTTAAWGSAVCTTITRKAPATVGAKAALVWAGNKKAWLEASRAAMVKVTTDKNGNFGNVFGFLRIDFFAVLLYQI